MAADRKAIAKAINDSIEHAMEWAPDWASCCESPIEELLFAALWTNGSLSGRVDFFSYPKTHSEMLEIVKEYDGPFRAFGCPQMAIGDYRADFGLVMIGEPGEDPIVLAVECDGHDFHDRTKEQAQRDRQRDRDLLSRGVCVMRFTGSEIWKDAAMCAETIIDHVYMQGISQSVDAMYRRERQAKEPV
jgi:very-short-patch-repair endonuclease